MYQAGSKPSFKPVYHTGLGLAKRIVYHTVDYTFRPNSLQPKFLAVLPGAAQIRLAQIRFRPGSGADPVRPRPGAAQIRCGLDPVSDRIRCGPDPVRPRSSAAQIGCGPDPV